MGTFVKISNSTEKEDENRRGTFVELSTGKEIARNPDPPGGSPVTVKKASAKTETTKKKAPKNAKATVQKASAPAVTKAPKSVKPAEKATRKTTQADPAAYGWDPMVAQDLQNRQAQGTPAKKSPMPVTGAYARLQNQARQAAVDLDTEALARANNAMKTMRTAVGKQTVGDRVSDTASAVFSGSAGSLANLAGFAVNAYNDPAYYRRQIARMQAALAAGKTDDGLPLNDAKRRAIQQAIARMEAEAAKWERPDSLTNRIYGKADALQDDSGRFQTQAKQGLGPTGSLLVDAGVSMGQSTLDNAVGAVTGTGLLPFTLRAFGGAAQESRRTGADVSQQLVYGSAQAAKEYVTEKLFGLTGPQRLTGGGSLDSLVADGIRNVTERLSKTPAGQKALGGVLTWLASGATEGLEETIGSILESTLINPNLRQWDPDNRTAQQKFEDGLYETLVGAVSGLMGGVNNLAAFQTRANGTDQGPSNGPETTPSPAPESGGDQNGRQETAGRLLDLMRQIQAQREAEAARQTAQVAPQNTQAAPPPVSPTEQPDAVQAPQNAIRTVNGVPVLLQHVRNLNAGMDHETSARAIDDSMRKEAGTDLLNIIRRVQAQREAGTGQEIQQTPEAGQKQRQTEVTRLVDLIRQVQAQRENAASSEMDRVLKGRARVEYEQMPPDTQQAVDRAYEQGTVGMDAQNRVFQIDPERHIDRRDSGSVGNRKINAFQFDHPELHRFYADAAQGLLSDLAATQKGGQIESAPGVMSDGVTPGSHNRYWRTSRSTSPALAYLLDSEGMTYARIEKALNAILHDMGQENYADAKRVELVLDDMLSNGYEDSAAQNLHCRRRDPERRTDGWRCADQPDRAGENGGNCRL